MQRTFLRATSTAFMLFLSLPVIAQEIKAAEPGPEYTVVAGTGPFHVTVNLRSVETQRWRIYTQYVRTKTGDVKALEAPTNNGTFTCNGFTQPGKQEAIIECNAPLGTLGGIYRGNGTFTVTRDETSDTKDYPDIRLPIVTVEPNPLATSDFPDIVGTSLSLDHRQSLEDGSRKSQDVLNSLAAHIKPDTSNSKAVRAYLQQVAERERTILDRTRRLYLGDDPASRKVPIFFEDFDRRLKSIIRELGGTPYQFVAKNETGKVHFLLAQMPHTSDSVTATEKPGTISRSLSDLVSVLTDAVKGLLGMSESGTTSFHWSATTVPPGAEIYISRLDEPETKWAGMTDVKDATLENAIWTFRFDWNGCSKREKTNPFLQHTIDLKLAKEGCRRQ